MNTKPKQLPGLPGINAPIPPGGKGVAASANFIGKKRLAKALATFGNVKDSEELAPYGEAAEEWLEAAATQLGMTWGDVGPLEMAVLRGAAQQMFWAQVMFDRAALMYDVREDAKDPKLGDCLNVLESASNITNAYRGNILAANTLAAQHSATRAKGDQADPLASIMAQMAAEESEDE